MIPSDQISLAGGEYEGVWEGDVFGGGPWHSVSKCISACLLHHEVIVHTRRHVVDASGPEFSRPPLGGRKPEVSNGDLLPSMEAENVLRLEVSVEDARLMAILHSSHHLEEDVLDQCIVTQIGSVV